MSHSSSLRCIKSHKTLWTKRHQKAPKEAKLCASKESSTEIESIRFFGCLATHLLEIRVFYFRTVELNVNFFFKMKTKITYNLWFDHEMWRDHLILGKIYFSENLLQAQSRISERSTKAREGFSLVLTDPGCQVWKLSFNIQEIWQNK